MNSIDSTLGLFIEKAEAVSAIVQPVATIQEALEYTVRLCERKEACQLVASGYSPPSEVRTRTIAAPQLPDDQKKALDALCREREIQLLDHGLRGHLAGIDVGLTWADFAIADTGTLVIDSSMEEIRLATRISEIHVAILPRKKIRQTSYDMEKELAGNMGKSPNYTAFITGASRTADIERVLALGVHGPLELHILILEGN
jgi:L-lactate dehydrogenase complex protein LldG